MVIFGCTPCLMAPIKVGAAAILGSIGYSKIKKKKKKKNKKQRGGGKKLTKTQKEFVKVCKKAEKNKRLNPGMKNFDCESFLDQGHKEIKWMKGWYQDALKNNELDWDKWHSHYSKKNKRTNKKKKKNTKKQKGGSGMMETYDEMEEYNDGLFRQYSNDERELQKSCRYHLREGINEYKRKNIFDKDKAYESFLIKNNCDENKSYCRPCIEFKEKAYAAKALPPPPPPESQPFSWKPKSRRQLGESRSMRFRAADNTSFVKKLKAEKRSQHLRDTLDRSKHRRNKIRNLRKTRSASFGGGKKTKRRTRKLKR